MVVGGLQQVRLRAAQTPPALEKAKFEDKDASRALNTTSTVLPDTTLRMLILARADNHCFVVRFLSNFHLPNNFF